MSSVKITKTKVEGLETTGKQYEVMDTLQKGFMIRVGTTGRKTFYFQYRDGKGRTAKSQKVTIGVYPAITVEQAREIAKKLAAKVALGESPARDIQEQKKTLSLKEVGEIYIQEHVANLKPKTQVSYSSIFYGHIFPKLGKMKIDAVTTRALTKFHHGMRETPYHANRAIAVLSGLFSWSSKNGYTPKGFNPCQDVERYPEKRKDIFLNEEQLAQILTTLEIMEQNGSELNNRRKISANSRKSAEENNTDNEALKSINGKPYRNYITAQTANIFRLLILTGAREGEIQSLKWSYIDLNKGCILLPDSKTGFKKIELPEDAIAILKDIPHASEYVFPSPKEDAKTPYQSNIKDPWRDIMHFAGMSGEGWRIHDLRHAFASVAVNSGASLPIIGKALGHKNASTTARYAHVAESPAHKAAERTAGRIMDALKKHKSS